MKKTKTSYREKFSEKLMDLGNLIAAAMVFGQFISGREFSLIIFVSGLILMIICYTISYMVN